MVVQYFQLQTFSSIHQNFGILWIQEIAPDIQKKPMVLSMSWHMASEKINFDCTTTFSSVQHVTYMNNFLFCPTCYIHKIFSYYQAPPTSVLPCNALGPHSQ
jgi:hypothetical protein